MRYHGEKAVEQVRRRAEAQNIAVVKSLDGYVLAPMHEGRVVRSDVFRALPEALKRNVEAKITTLEGRTAIGCRNASGCSNSRLAKSTTR